MFTEARIIGNEVIETPFNAVFKVNSFADDEQFTITVGDDGEVEAVLDGKATVIPTANSVSELYCTVETGLGLDLEAGSVLVNLAAGEHRI